MIVALILVIINVYLFVSTFEPESYASSRRDTRFFGTTFVGRSLNNSSGVSRSPGTTVSRVRSGTT